jgi:hypothetical protein
MDRQALANEIEKQIEEAAQMGEPPSFALQRHDADTLLNILRTGTHGFNAARPEGVTIKLELLDFLSGIAALDGVWFGDEHPKYMGKYWWRRYLPDAPQDESPPPMNCGGEKSG